MLSLCLPSCLPLTQVKQLMHGTIHVPKFTFMWKTRCTGCCSRQPEEDTEKSSQCPLPAPTPRQEPQHTWVTLLAAMQLLPGVGVRASHHETNLLARLCARNVSKALTVSPQLCFPEIVTKR